LSQILVSVAAGRWPFRERLFNQVRRPVQTVGGFNARLKPASPCAVSRIVQDDADRVAEAVNCQPPDRNRPAHARPLDPSPDPRVPVPTTATALPARPGTSPSKEGVFNTKERAVIRIWLAVVLAMSLFPPWRWQYRYSEIRYEKTAGYGFFLYPPAEARLYDGTGVHFDSSYINLPLLITQWVIVTAAAAIIISFLKGQKRDNHR
jgi:hypothetical protein